MKILFAMQDNKLQYQAKRTDGGQVAW